jgi:HlyD family secretion protein
LFLLLGKKIRVFFGDGMHENKSNQILKRILFLLLFILTGCQSKTDIQDTALSVPIVVGPISNTLTFVGNVKSSESSTLTWKTSGVVEDVKVRLGDSVTVGQELAVLEEETLSADVIKAEIPLIEAKESFNDLQISETAKAQAYKDLRDKEVALRDAELFAEGLKYPIADQEEIDAAKKALDGAKDAYDNASEEYQSVILRDHLDEQKKSLYEKLQSTLNAYAKAYDLWLYDVNNTSENTKKQAAADIEVAKAAYEDALKTFQTYSDGFPRKEDIKSAELSIETAQENYNKRSILADINGIVTIVNPRSGDYVTKGETAVRIDNRDRLFVPINISEIDIVKIKNGQEADVVLDANTGKTYKGIVNKISRQGDETDNSVSFETYVEIMDPDDSIKIGMTAEIHIILEKKTDVLLTASNAILSEDGHYYVEVLHGAERRKIPVEIGLTDGVITEITSGEVSEGDSVVVPSIESKTLSELNLSNTSGQSGFPPSVDGQAPQMQRPIMSETPAQNFQEFEK